MFTVLIQSLVLASGGILSVGSITIVILLLISEEGWRNGVAYMSGYVAGYTLIGVSAVLVGANVAQSGSGGGGMISSVLLLVFGTLLLWMTQRNWRKPRIENENAEPPRLFAILDGITPPKALAFGAAVTVINFKNLAIFLSAVSVLLLSDLPLATQMVIVLLVVFVFCTSVIVPVLIYLSFPERAYERLNWLKQTLETYSRPIGIWVPLVFGLLFLVRGIRGLL